MLLEPLRVLDVHGVVRADSADPSTTASSADEDPSHRRLARLHDCADDVSEVEPAADTQVLLVPAEPRCGDAVLNKHRFVVRGPRPIALCLELDAIVVGERHPEPDRLHGAAEML